MKKAILDMGSNTMRLSVYQIEDDGHFHSLFSEKETAGLVNYISDGKMSVEGMDKACAVILRFKQLLSQIGMEEINIFATASLRNIQNTEEAVEYIKEKTGEKPDVISGQEEAELGYYGALSDINIGTGTAFDIGGGSTEIVHFCSGDIIYAKSYGIGSLNLFNSYVKGLWPDTDEEKKIKHRVKEVLSEAVTNSPSETICGIGGTNRALLNISNAYFKKPSDNNMITKDELKKLKKVILAKDDITKKLILKNCPDRLHTIIPGMLITCEMAKIFKSDQIIISKNGVREGYLCKKLLPGITLE